MAPAEPTPPRLRVEVAYSQAARATAVVTLDLAPGSTLADAVQASGLFEGQGPVWQGLACGIWGRRQPASTVLRDGDRVEVYRGLLVDPKEARRLRYKGQPKAKRPAGAGR